MRFAYYTWLVVIGSLCMVQCRTAGTSLAVAIEETILLDSLPSGSGMAVVKDAAWVVSDDATAVYYLPLSGKNYRRIPYGSYDPSLYRLPKPIKPDLESAVAAKVNGVNLLFAFGSGSFSPQRDSLLIFDMDKEKVVRFVSLTPLYNTIKQKAALDSGMLNVEGAVIAGKYIYLLNRAKGHIYGMVWNDLAAYFLKPDTLPIPAINVHTVTLPVYDGLTAGFSGACVLSAGTDDKILFSASLENVHDWTQDGTVYGSYIGVLSIKGDKIGIEKVVLLEDGDGNVIKEKVESLDGYGKYPNGDLRVAGMVDNDNGSSKLLLLRIKR